MQISNEEFKNLIPEFCINENSKSEDSLEKRYFSNYKEVTEYFKKNGINFELYTLYQLGEQTFITRGYRDNYKALLIAKHKLIQIKEEAEIMPKKRGVQI